MLYGRGVLLIFTVSLILTVTISANGQDAKPKLYVWDFSMTDGSQTNNTARLTLDFEEAIIKTGKYQVLERRRYDRLMAHRKNEIGIQNLEKLSPQTQKELRTIEAEIVVFGVVDDDVDGGQYTVSVSLQKFDSTIIGRDSV